MGKFDMANASLSWKGQPVTGSLKALLTMTCFYCSGLFPKIITAAIILFSPLPLKDYVIHVSSSLWVASTNWGNLSCFTKHSLPHAHTKHPSHHLSD